jgi:hypothetical protein
MTSDPVVLPVLVLPKAVVAKSNPKTFVQLNRHDQQSSSQRVSISCIQHTRLNFSEVLGCSRTLVNISLPACQPRRVFQAAIHLISRHRRKL